LIPACCCNAMLHAAQERTALLASLAEDPTQYAQGVGVLDSIVKVFTVYSRCGVAFALAVSHVCICSACAMMLLAATRRCCGLYVVAALVAHTVPHLSCGSMLAAVLLKRLLLAMLLQARLLSPMAKSPKA
jgi:hypothetical protein